MNIGDRVIVGAQAGVMADIVSDSRCVGSPATGEREQLVIQAAIGKLPILRRQFRELRRQVEGLLEDSAEQDLTDSAEGSSQDAA